MSDLRRKKGSEPKLESTASFEFDLGRDYILYKIDKHLEESKNDIYKFAMRVTDLLESEGYYERKVKREG